jgi:hypothetical protein
MKTLLLAPHRQLVLVAPVEEGHANDDRPPGGNDRRPRCA